MGDMDDIPACTAVWCFPCLDTTCGCCPTCCAFAPFLFYCMPCCCCCCRPEDEYEESESESEISAKKKNEKEKEIEEEEEIDVAEEEDLDKVEDGDETRTSADSTITESSGATTTSAAPMKKKRKAKAAASTKKKDVKHNKPAMFTGATGVTVKIGEDEVIGEAPEVPSLPKTCQAGAYLIYSTKNNGSLCIKWSQTALKTATGVLAYIKLESAIPQFKLSKDEELVKNLCTTLISGVPNDRKPFFKAWVTFMKYSYDMKGEFVLLNASELSPPPPMKVAVLLNKTVKVLKVGETLKHTDLKLAAILPAKANFLQENEELDSTTFATIAELQGALLSSKN